jgi:ubiquinone/menaquinone biosynthesis C-methylase UbiE
MSNVGQIGDREMGTPEEAKTRAAITYNAASDRYDDPANSFWERFGRRTIERLNLSPGARALDVCCGSGASAIPAAEAVGPNGLVLGVDLAEDLLDLARTKARQRGLNHIEFRTGDVLNLGLSESDFDAVICVFGIFFVPDMQAAARELWRLVCPGGKLAITTWGPRFFEPMNTAFWNSVREVRPDLYKGFNPWDRLSDPDSVRSMLAGAGVYQQEVVLEGGTHPLRSPEDWWTMVLGTGYRGTIEQLDAECRERTRRANLNFICGSSVSSVEANVIYAIATVARSVNACAPNFPLSSCLDSSSALPAHRRNIVAPFSVRWLPGWSARRLVRVRGTCPEFREQSPANRGNNRLARRV